MLVFLSVFQIVQYLLEKEIVCPPQRALNSGFSAYMPGKWMLCNPIHDYLLSTAIVHGDNKITAWNPPKGGLRSFHNTHQFSKSSFVSV